MTVFDAIKDGQEYNEERCLETGAAHNYYEDETWVDGDRWYQKLICTECGHESTGYSILDK